MRTVKTASRANLEKIVAEFDKDGNGAIDVKEVAQVVETLVNERTSRKYLVWTLIGMAVFAAIMIGALTGMVWAVVGALRVAEVRDNGVMYVKGSTSQVVQTANNDMSVVGGVLVNRHAYDPTDPSAAATAATDPNATAVLRTATFLGSPHRFTSEVSVRALMELKYLYIQGTGRVELALAVHGVARVPQDGSTYGTVVHILTTAGTITLDGTAIDFQEDIAPVFIQAGFAVSSGRRSLLGLYDVLGFFNFIANMSVFNLPPEEARPALPAGNFMMRLKVYEPCATVFTPNKDRCSYLAPTPPSPAAPAPPFPPYMPLLPEGLPPPPSAPATAGPTASPDASATVAPTTSTPGPDGPATGAPAPSTSATSTGSTRRLLQAQPETTAGTSGSGLDLAGTTLVNGTRYMVHYETATFWNGLVRTVYEYAQYPGYVRVELADNTTMAMAAWQQEVGQGGSSPATYFCSSQPMSPTALDKLSNASIANFSFVGYDYYNGRSARHFQLVVRQRIDPSYKPPSDPSVPRLPEALTVDYWDSRLDRSPLGFEFAHPFVGRVIIEVAEFRALAASDVNVTDFVAPVSGPACPNSTTVPRVTSAFSVKKAAQAAGDGGAAYAPSAAGDDLVLELPSHRHLAEEKPSSEATSGTSGAAFEDSVAGRSASTRHHAARRSQLTVTKDDYCGGSNPWIYNFQHPQSPCGFGMAFVGPTNQYVILDAKCSGAFKSFPAITVEGAAYFNLCPSAAKAEASITATFGLGYLAERYGGFIAYILEYTSLADLASLSMSGGYDFANLAGYVTGSFESNFLVAKGILSAELRFNGQRFWLDSAKAAVRLEVSIPFTGWSGDLEEYVIAQDVTLYQRQLSDGKPPSPPLKSPPPAAVPAAAPGATYLGCYGDDLFIYVDTPVVGKRASTAMDLVVGYSDKLTLDMCKQMAVSKGYRYFGAGNGKWCLGSNNYAQATYFGHMTPDLTSTVACYMTCPGNTATKCGGLFGNSLYDAGALPPAPNPPPPSPPPPPLASQGPGYMGCFASYDQNGWMMDQIITVSSSGFTIEKCLRAATSQGYRFFGVLRGIACFGSNNLVKATSLGQRNYGSQDLVTCDMPCTGNSATMCGGYYAQSIFDSYQFPMNSLGCFGDGPDRRMEMIGGLISSLTPRMCRHLAVSKRYRYFGMQYASYCFGSNDITKAKSYGSANFAGQPIICDSPCSGNASATCGGGWANSVYDSGVFPLFVLGCFGDGPTKPAMNIIGYYNDLTATKCKTLAVGQGYRYYAVQNGNACFGSNNLTRATIYGNTDSARNPISCNVPCTGNASASCGGVLANRLFDSGYLGCYTDGPDRRLPVFLETSATMTVERCRDLAQAAGHNLYGLQYASYCFAGNEYAKALSYGVSTSCNMACAGGDGLKCGGPYANSVYATVDTLRV